MKNQIHFNEYKDAAYWQQKRNEQREAYIRSEKVEYVCTAIVVASIFLFTYILGTV